MSVVRKYQSGGQTTTTSLEDYLANILKEEKFNKDGLAYARNAASLFAKLAKEPNFNEIFEFDPINNAYAIHVDKIQDPYLKTLDWSGSTKHGRPNIFGTNTGRDIKGEEGSGEKKYMGWAAGNLYNYMKQKNASNTNTVTNPGVTTTAATSKGLEYNPLSFDDAMDAMRFKPGSDMSFESLLGVDKSNQAREGLLMQIGAEYLQDYINQAAKETEKGNIYNSMDRVQKALAAAKSGNFEQFRQAALGLDWDVNSYLLSPQTIAEQKRQDELVAAQNKRLEFEKAGREFLPAETLAALADAGYTNFAAAPGFLSTANSPELQEWFTNNQIRTVTNEYGDERLIGPIFPGGLLQDTYKFNQLNSPLYGSYIGRNNLGKLTYFNEGVEGYDPSQFPQYTGTGKEFRGIAGSVNGLKDWKIFGEPKKIGDKYSFTQTLILQDPEGGHYQVTGDPITGQYKDKSGKTFNIKLDDYNEASWEVPFYGEILGTFDKDLFSTVGEQPFKGDFSQLEVKVAELLAQGVSSKNLEEWKNTIAQLRYLLKQGDYIDKKNAARVYKALLEDQTLIKAFTPRKRSGLENFIINAGKRIGEDLFILPTEEDKKKINSKKTGGVLKLQKGNRLTKEEYLKILQSDRDTVPTLNIKDWRGTLKDMSDLEKAGLVAAGASILPGVGALGAGAVTAIDIMRMAQGEDVGLGTIAADLGFTGLSLIGLGGIGAATRAGKVALNAERLAKLTKEAQAVKDATRIGKLSKSTTTAVEKLAKITPETRSLKGLGFTDDELKALRESGIIGKKANRSTLLRKGSQEKIAKEIAEFKKPIQLPNQIITEESSKLAKAAKIGRSAFAITAGAPLVLSVPKVASQWAEGGIENIQQQDLKNTLFAAAGVTGFLKNRQGAKNIRSLIKSEKTEPHIEYKGNKYTDMEVPTETEVKKSFWSDKLPKGKKAKTKAAEVETKAKEEYLKKIDEFKKDLAVKYKADTDQELPADFKISDVKIIKESSVDKGIKTRDEVASMTTRNYERARKAIERSGITSYSRPSWIYKKGGILKYQNPFAPLPKKQFSISQNFKPTPSINDIYNTHKAFIEGQARKAASQATPATAGATTATSIQSIPLEKRILFPSQDPTLGMFKPLPLAKLPGFNSTIPRPKIGFNLDKSKYPNIFGLPKEAANIPTIPTATTATTVEQNLLAEGMGYDTREGFNLGKLAEKINPTDILRLAQLGSANYYNNQATKQYIKAIQESYSPDLLAKRVNLKMPSIFNPQVEKEAANYTQVGRRIAGATTDWDKGVAARLEAERGASDIRLKGALESQQAINQLTGKQQEFDYQVAETNRGVVNTNRAKYADRNSRIAQTLGLKTATQGNIMENFLQATGTSVQNKMDEKKRDAATEKYLGLFNDPQYKAMMKEYNENLSEATLAEKKKAFLDAQAKSGNKTPSQQTFETSQEYIDFIKRRTELERQIKERSEAISMASMAYKMGLPADRWGTFKSGGTLREKIILENEKSNNRLVLEKFKQDNKIMLERTKQAYKAILQNNRLMSNVLLRAFK